MQEINYEHPRYIDSGTQTFTKRILKSGGEL